MRSLLALILCLFTVKGFASIPCSKNLQTLASSRYATIAEEALQNLDWSRQQQRSFVRLMSWLDGAELWKGESFDHFDVVGGKLKEIPDQQSAVLLAKLYRDYPDFPKDASESLPKKRLVDLLINQLSDEGRRMHQRVESGESVWNVYADFLASQKSLFREDSDYGQYSDFEVQKAATILRQWLVENGLGDLKIRMAGSFPSGRAKWNGDSDSDVDLLVPEEWLEGLAEKQKRKLLKELQTQFQGSDIRLVVDEFTPEAFESNFKASHPVFIEINGSEIGLVFHPAEYSGVEGGRYIVNNGASFRHLTSFEKRPKK